MITHGRELITHWNRFWFEPQGTASLGLFRIAFGVVATAWTLSLAPYLLAFFGPDGVLPQRRGRLSAISILALSNSNWLLLLVYTATLIGCVALTVGFHSRLAGWIVFVGILSIQHRNGILLNAGDSLIRCLALMCAISPTGAALSVDRLRSDREHFWEFPTRPLWSVRLIQVFISAGYLTAVWDKMQGAPWRTGTAVSYALRVLDIQRLPLPAFVSSSYMISEALTFGTLAIEAAIGIFVWNRKLRPYVLLLGVSLHLGIDVVMTVGFFSYTMLTTYIAFIPPDTAKRFVLRVRERYTRWRSSGGSKSIDPELAADVTPTPANRQREEAGVLTMRSTGLDKRMDGGVSPSPT